jgi:AraC-like DNA-binding protein
VVGSGGVLIVSIDPALLSTLVAASGRPDAGESFRQSVFESERLGVKLRALLDTMRSADAGVVLRELLDLTAGLAEPRSEAAAAPAGEVDGTTAGMVEWLSADTCTQLDLATLADWTGLSRFQAVRAFKRRYGLPPYAYRLRARLSLARTALKRGVQPARVAAECGFSDQSHLTRHFKRVFGVTPAQYARIGVGHSASTRPSRRVSRAAA